MDQHKYLKYKIKYLKLKRLRLEQYGGTIPYDSSEWYQISNWSEITPQSKHIQYNGDEQIPPELAFYDSIKSLKFGLNFNNEGKPLTRGLLPVNIETIYFGDSFDNGRKSLTSGLFPDSLKSLSFGDNFNNGNRPIRSHFFPNRLESLTFGDGFNNGNQPLVPGLFPDSLLSLEFGEYFSNGNKPLQPNRFPKNLQSIRFGDSFNNGGLPLKPGLFPDELQSLYMVGIFNNGNKPITDQIFPPKLKSLFIESDFNNGKRPLEFGSFPNSLKYIFLGGSFDNGGHSLKPGIFPDSLESLAFGDYFNNGGQPLIKELFPDKLSTLIFGNSFNNGGQPLIKGLFPDSLEQLGFGNSFTNGDQPIEPGLFPNSLDQLIFGNSFTNGDQPLIPKLFPDRLLSLIFGNGFNNGGQPLIKGLFPNSLEELVFGDGFTNGDQPLEPDLFPDGLNFLIFGDYFNNGGTIFKMGILPLNLNRLKYGHILSDVHKQYVNIDPENWWKLFKKIDDPQLNDLASQLDLDLYNLNYLHQFKLTINTDPMMVSHLIKTNVHHVVNLFDLNELVGLLRKILKITNVGDQERKRLVKQYIKLFPSELAIGLYPSTEIIQHHLETWKQYIPKYHQIIKKPTQIHELHFGSDEFDRIEQQFYNSFAPIDQYIISDFIIMNLYQIHIPSNIHTWTNRTNPTTNVVQVWHGTKQSNLLSILRSGFTPINTPSSQIIPKKTGNMFGSGLYFADNVSKSLYYSDYLREYCSQDDPSAYGWVLLCSLDAGNVYHAKESDVSQTFSLPTGFDSLYADPSDIHSIQRSERMITDSSRVKCDYLLRVVCNI